MKTIFLDFDGVLFDSQKEAYLLARYAYYNISVHNEIKKFDYEKFCKFRYLVTKSFQFYYIFELLEQGINDYRNFENKYYELLNIPIQEKVKDFDSKYINKREDLIKNDFSFWDNLDTPFDFFFHIKELSSNTNWKFIILTNKKNLPVKNKLIKYNAENIELYTNEDLIKFKNKAEFIIEYIKDKNISQCFLVEDSIDNLKSCKNHTEIIPLLVNWGYKSPNEKGLTQEEILNLIKEH